MKKPNILIIAIAVAMPVMGMTIISPALSEIKSNLNVSFSDTQLVLSMYFLSLAIGQLISGPLSDRFGRRPIIIFGAFLPGINAVQIIISLFNAAFSSIAACFFLKSSPASLAYPPSPLSAKTVDAPWGRGVVAL